MLPPHLQLFVRLVFRLHTNFIPNGNCKTKDAKVADATRVGKAPLDIHLLCYGQCLPLQFLDLEETTHVYVLLSSYEHFVLPFLAIALRVGGLGTSVRLAVRIAVSNLMYERRTCRLLSGSPFSDGYSCTEFRPEPVRLLEHRNGA